MINQIITLPTREILIIFMMLCRISGVFLLISPFGDTSVRPIIRIALALSISIMMYGQFGSVISPSVQALASDDAALTLTIISELCIGIAFAIIVKILISAVQVAGLTIASQIGLSAAAILDQFQQVQNSTLGILLLMLTTIVMLESGAFMQIIGGVYNSYHKIPLGGFFGHYNDFTSLVTEAVGKMWSVGIQISMPFILINIATMIGAGILAKLMPQMQVFFLLVPVQIFIG